MCRTRLTSLDPDSEASVVASVSALDIKTPVDIIVPQGEESGLGESGQRRPNSF